MKALVNKKEQMLDIIIILGERIATEEYLLRLNTKTKDIRNMNKLMIKRRIYVTLIREGSDQDALLKS